MRKDSTEILPQYRLNTGKFKPLNLTVLKECTACNSKLLPALC